MRKIQTKLAVLSAASVLCLATLAFLVLRKAYDDYRDLESFQETSTISQTAYALAKAITDERQAAYNASAFLGEGTPAEQLDRYRAKIESSKQTLQRLRELAQKSDGQFSPRFAEGLATAINAEAVANELRKEILDPARPQITDPNSKLKSRALTTYDTILLAQANFLPVLCNETEDAELVRKIVTQDNIARLQKDFWKIKGLVGSAIRSNKLTEGAGGELKVKLVSLDDQVSRLKSLGDPQVVAGVQQLITSADYRFIAEAALKLRDKGIGMTDMKEFGDSAGYQSGPNARVERAFAALSDAGMNAVTTYTAARLAEARVSLLVYGGISITAVVGITFLIVVIARSITRPLRALSEDLAGTASHATESARIIAESSNRLSDDACEQASALEEISASMEELSSMTNSNLEHVRQMSGLAERALLTTDDGVKSAEELSRAMGAIQQSTKDVEGILKSIDEIAFQTNILALNAAVEAARAGSAGAGFAIVADEVRALAQRSAQAARETAAKIDVAVKSCAQGARLGEHARERFVDIAKITGEYHTVVKDVDAASQQSREGLNQVAEAVTKVDGITQRTAAAAQENAAASAEMKAQVDGVFRSAHQLEGMVVSAEAHAKPAQP